MVVQPAGRVAGCIRVPGDKSISHRYALVAALADGPSSIEGYAPGADCHATLQALLHLGVPISRDERGALTVHGRGLGGLSAAAGPIDACNSGTTLRLLAGMLAAHPFTSVLTGDDSLRRRPMRRIITPLSRMGARIRASDGDRPPLTIAGAGLSAIEHAPDVPSAQVKSSVLLAGLHADGRTRVIEPAPTRNHSELALAAFGASVDCHDRVVSIVGGTRLHARRLDVPGDLSSAAFWAVAAAALPGSDVTCLEVGLNPTRTAILDVLARAGAAVERTIERVEAGEPRGSIRVRAGDHRPLTIGAVEVPAVIDELPALAALATFGGALNVSGASELRVKESDRIACLAQGLRALGADIEERPDGFHISGRRRLSGGTADAVGDHRLAMAFAIAALGADRPSVILGASSVDISYPGFFEVLSSLAR
ncbi:MAG: 3-phosphoshikimate 1-carboxyvinyltransferase [Acidobacteria bacterium]|nr:3-phosphoshikimate 1-carboxyvinyltransferase [Acidobacteriota bacterium]